MFLKKNTKEFDSNIQGLRGLSVIFVLLFHFDIELFSFGYVGVDIFFFISGYIITKNLIESNLSFSKFVTRRILRLLPALISVKILIILFIIIYFNDFTDIKIISETLLSSFLFLSNIFLKLNYNYFDSNSLNPLIHTWSLSNEWQYYLTLCPIILFFKNEFLRNIYFYLIIIFLIFINVFLNQFGGNLSFKYPFFEDKFDFSSESIFFDFFSPLTRVWEFLIGSFCYINKTKYKNLKINYYFQSIILICFISLCCSLNFYSEFKYLIIFFIITILSINMFIQKSILNKFLELKLLLFIGTISYSLYLIHYPIIVFTKYLYFFDKNIIFYTIISFLIIGLSYLNFRYIEEFFRKKNLNLKKNLIFFSLSGIFFFISLSFLLTNNYLKKENFKIYSKYNFSNQVIELSEIKNIEKERNIRKTLILNNKNNFNENIKKKILVIGDSHALDFYNLINKKEVTDNFQISLKKIDINKFTKNIKLQNFEGADIIIISIRYFPYLNKTKLKNDIKDLKKLIFFLKKNNKKILLINNGPVFETNSFPLKTIILRNKNKTLSEKDLKTKIYSLIYKEVFYVNQLLLENFNNQIKIFDKFNLVCSFDGNTCSYKDKDDNIIFFDKDHIHTEAAKNIKIPNFIKIINNL